MNDHPRCSAPFPSALRIVIVQLAVLPHATTITTTKQAELKLVTERQRAAGGLPSHLQKQKPCSPYYWHMARIMVARCMQPPPNWHSHFALPCITTPAGLQVMNPPTRLNPHHHVATRRGSAKYVRMDSTVNDQLSKKNNEGKYGNGEEEHYSKQLQPIKTALTTR